MRWASQFAGDSSPQVTFDFMNYTEERYIFNGSDNDIAQRALLNSGLGVSISDCFKHIRRAMACQVIGLANAGVAQKFIRFVKNMRITHEVLVVRCCDLGSDCA